MSSWSSYYTGTKSFLGGGRKMKFLANFNKYLLIPLTCIITGVVLLVVLNFKGLESIPKTAPSENHSSERVRLKLVSDKAGYNPVKEFTLTSHWGDKASLSDYMGKVVILLFGYTYCPDICPMQLNDMVEVMDNLGYKSKHVQVLFVTVDPLRDTPEVLKNHLAFFHPSFVGLTGTIREIFSVARKFNVRYIRQEIDSASGYVMRHTPSIYLIDDQGQLQNNFEQMPGVSYWDQMSKAILKLINKSTET